MSEDIGKSIQPVLDELRDIKGLLIGLDDRPGLLHDVKDLKQVIYGNGVAGLVHKVNIIWRAHVWLLCTASGFAGSIITLIAYRAVAEAV